MSQIINLTSEALQAKIRELLPSQQGFGEDLQAINVVTPIIDLTPTAEGSGVRQDLQTALAFGSQTAFDFSNSTVTLANSPGFWRVTGISNSEQATGAATFSSLSLTDGLSTKVVWKHVSLQGAGDSLSSLAFDYTFYLDVGESITATTNNAQTVLTGSYRQIATTQGVLVNPSGFNPQ